MIIESKVIAAVIFSVAAFFLLCWLMVLLLGIRNVDKGDRLYVVVAIIISFIFSFSLIKGGIMLWQI